MKNFYVKAAWLTCAFTCTLSTIISAQTFNPVTPALGFNVFAKNGVTLQAGDTHGPLAMGGNLTLNGNTIMSMNTTGSYPNGAGNNDNYGLVIGGKVIFTSGNTSTLNKGILRIGDTTGVKLWYKDNNNNPTNLQVTAGAYNSNPQVQLQRIQPDSATLPHNINFTQAYIQLNNYSNYISNYNNSTACNSQLNKINIPGSNNPHINLSNTKVNYIYLTTTQLTNLNSQGSLIFDDAPSASRILVINVEGTGAYSFSPPNMGGVSEPDGRYIIWNFHGITSLTLTGGNSVYGTIFAPNAAINKTGANNSNGQVIGQSVTIACCEIHYYPFEGNLPQCLIGGVLPMDGIDLSAVQKGNDVQVNWIVYNESDMKAYTVEKSTDGSRFEAAGTVSSRGAANINNYTFTDNNAANGTVYYRIKADELSGYSVYSNTTVLKIAGKLQQLNAAPNPFTDHISVSMELAADTKITATLTDLTGKTIRRSEQQVSKGIAQVNMDGLNDLVPGFYVLHVQDDSGVVSYTAKMVK